jgi:hypothetical protein
MSYLRKLCLGPVRTETCRQCGHEVSVSWLALLAVVPFLLSLLLAGHWGYFVVVPVVLAGFAGMSLIHLFLIPLVPRGA